jgi:hypothetical protein
MRTYSAALRPRTRGPRDEPAAAARRRPAARAEYDHVSMQRSVVASARRGANIKKKKSIGGEVLTVGFIRQVAIRALSSRVPPKATPMEGVGAC